MPDQVKSSRRKYHSPLRADQAEQTRRRVLEAAFRLFVERGYAGTTMTAVAEDAGVSPETIYLTFGGKRGLLEGVIEMAIAGEDDPPTQENPWWATVAQLPAAQRSTAENGRVQLQRPCPAPARFTLSSAERLTRSRSPLHWASVCCTIG